MVGILILHVTSELLFTYKKIIKNNFTKSNSLLHKIGIDRFKT